MSWEALAYVEELKKCPDGARLAPVQKYLAHILARYHNTARHRAWPSHETLAREMNTDKSTVKRYLAYLGEHGVILKLRPEKSGRTWTLAYSFPQIDDAAEPEALTPDDTKGVHVAPLFSPEERGSKGVHPEQKRGAEGVQRTQRNKEEPGNLETRNSSSTSDSLEPDSSKTGSSQHQIAVPSQHIDRQKVLEALEGWIPGPRDGGVVDEDALERHISAVLQEDPAASTEEIVRYTRAKGPILWVEKPTDFGTRLVPRIGIHDPAAYLRKGVQNCFAGKNPPVRRHRARVVQEERAEKDSAGSQQAPEKSQSRDLEPNPWLLVLASLERKIDRHSFETWLKPTRFSHSQGPRLFVKVPNPDFCHIGDKYGDLISEAIENLDLEYQYVEFVTGEKVA